MSRSLATQPHESGFTLVELLVALLIFGMLSAAGVALLSFSARAQEASGERLAAVADLRRMSGIIANDLAQAAPRLTRDEAGAPQPAFKGGDAPDDDAALAFVRHGWENWDGAPRASLQKVEYRLSGDRLERRFYPHLDGAAPLPPLTLAEGVTDLRLRFRDEKGEWRERWDPAEPDMLPRAVEMVITTDTGSLRQLFLTGSGI